MINLFLIYFLICGLIIYFVIDNFVKDLNVNVESNTDRIKIIENKIAGDIAYPWIGSEFEYEQLAVKDPNKFYYLYEE